ncbi:MULTISPECIES: MaoC/PaaZ C-terminal domain-containing protein [unclassified Acinetobacter]|uniref:MaoC/PaaZ C-terminal domain-containing protein n=1 Tax=unclassified Acinetobacter TaxID=196816 RepID=UPI00293417D6|nr:MULTISPECIES: MaoC/PaaZ C-terminal domain-containing protein [unclassified Acinetobacter]WOE32322.1 MaoC/PaaZ C-terminal domain-containing protein [Acinetobacter sp. SAAs470]WOE37795.1 MaoC/PaaZ C-terminal domain-containing protein [Acinetobacter sp. SAAs474]
MNIRHFAALPKPYLTYPKVIQGLIFKPSKAKQSLAEVEYIVDHLLINQRHLAAYNKICGFQDDQYVSAIYLAMLSQSLQMHMMTKEDFPFPILGLVHIRNNIKQFRTIIKDEQLSLSCKFGELRPHDKGIQFDFIVTAKAKGQVVMKALMTYLCRQHHPQQKSSSHQDHCLSQPDYKIVAQWHILENIGRRYAFISGDFNLIHLHRVSAKAFGFKQAIAHGMWTHAKVLANLALPEQYETDVAFKLPIYLPSSVDFLTATQHNQTDFLIQNSQNKKPHLMGSLKQINVDIEHN